MLGMSEERRTLEDKNLCRCGCGQKVGKTYWDHYGNKKYSIYVNGHNQRGKHGGTWKKHHGRHKRNEYWYVWKPEHHFCIHGKYVLEHRLVYEEYYKCVLMSWADVHHLDGNTENNNISNLFACMHRDHTILENMNGVRAQIFSKGHNYSPWNKGKKVGYTWNKGIPRSEEVKRKISESRRGRIPWNKGRKTVKELYKP